MRKLCIGELENGDLFKIGGVNFSVVDDDATICDTRHVLAVGLFKIGTHIVYSMFVFPVDVSVEVEHE